MTFLAACLGAPQHDPAALCFSILSGQRAPSARDAWGEEDVGLAAAAVPLLAGGVAPVLGETADGRWVLAFDARLDDRADLAAALGLTRAPPTGPLLLAAWQAWGIDTPERLCGDFALIAWDRHERRLILARDPFGQRPLFFRSAGPGFAAASMPAGLAASSGDVLRPDLDRLMRDLNHHVEAVSTTYYAGIERVEPGECVTLRTGVAPVRRLHWRPDTTPLTGRTTAEWGEALHAALIQSAADRVPDGAPRLASQLSAGLDSAGVTAAAARAGVEILALTAVPSPGAPLTVPPGRLALEAPLAAATAAFVGATHQPVSADRSFVALLDDAFKHLAQPIPNPFNHPWADAIFAETQRSGINVLMCGQSGNFTFSVDASAPGRPAWRSALRAIVPARLRAHLRHGQSDPGDWTLAARLLPPEPQRDAAGQGLAILHAMDPGALMRGTFCRWGVDLRDVTADRRLAEMALRIPDSQRMSDGLGRAPARLALAGLVPDAVRFSTRRGYQAADWLHVMTADLPAIRHEVAAIAASPTARTLIDVPRLQRLVDNWPRSLAYHPDVERLYRHVVPQAIATAGWARRAMGET